MARPGKARPKIKVRPNGGSRSSGKLIESYEDTLEPGGVDDLMFQRDQILFDDSGDANQEDDINADQGDEVLGLPEYGNGLAYDDEDDDNEEYEPAESSSSKRKGKAKAVDNAKRGRFAKEDVEEHEGGSDEGSSSDEEGWGRQYYSKPSNRRAKEDPTQYEATREEERELEENEVKRLQKKARSSLQGVEDWGFDAEAMTATVPVEELEETVVETVEAPQTDDPATLLRHMETHETLKLALARELPLVIEKLEKTGRGMKALHENQTSEGTLQKGLGWLHYQILLTYSSTLAYYIHLCALPADTRPNLTEHPILDRLLRLKEGLSQLEDLDFAADSDSESEGEEVDDDEAQLVQNKRELMMRMFEMAGVSPNGSQSEEDLDESWRTADLEDGELNALLAEAEGSELEDLLADAEQMPDLPLANGSSGPVESKKKKKKAKKFDVTLDEAALGGLVEPDFQSISSSRPSKSTQYDDVIGDPTSLDEADASDKEHRKRSLQFHTSKINSTSARRAAARSQRFGGDDDIPRRDRQAARDAVLRRNGPEPLEDDNMSGQWLQDKDETVEVSDDTGYYDLVQRSQAQKQAAKDAAHLETQSERQRVNEDPHDGGPRALTRAIEKNRGLTPRRSKSSRNPRVKKRMAYDKAKKKVSSQGPVFKGGQASLQGRYGGETSGISSAIRSKRF